jgi:predicted transcriptional regulator
MTAKVLKDVLERVETWPEEAQQELVEIALEIDAGLSGGVYHATPDELQGIDRGLQAAREGRFASDAEVEAVFAKYRRA